MDQTGSTTNARHVPLDERASTPPQGLRIFTLVGFESWHAEFSEIQGDIQKRNARSTTSPCQQ